MILSKLRRSRGLLPRDTSCLPGPAEPPGRVKGARKIGLAGLALAILACGGQDASTSANGGILPDGSSEDIAQDVPDSQDRAFCTRTSECVVLPADCCRSDCGEGAIVGTNGLGARDFASSCLGRGCTQCRVSARWAPRCVDGRCVVIDLDTSPQSACRADADCQLRWGSACCDKCFPDPAFDLVSVSRSASFCAPDDICDPCSLPPFPTTARVVCTAEHCKVQP